MGMMWISARQIALSLSFMLVGLLIVLINKYIFSVLQFPYPFFVSLIGVVTSSACAHLLVFTGFVSLNSNSNSSNNNNKISNSSVSDSNAESSSVVMEGFNLQSYVRVLPICFMYAVSLALGNLVYMYLDVGFIQMLKSFNPVMIIAVGYFSNIDIPTLSVMFSVILISVGTAATCSFSPHASWIGLLIMFGAESLEAARLVYTQHLLHNRKFGVIESQYYIAPISSFFLFLGFICFEWSSIHEHGEFQIVVDHWLFFVLTGVAGMGMNFLSYYVIQSTSSLTMKVLGGIRNVITIVIAIVEYKEQLDSREIAGYMVALIGFLSYSAAKADFWSVETTCLLQTPSNKKDYNKTTKTDEIIEDVKDDGHDEAAATETVSIGKVLITNANREPAV